MSKEEKIKVVPATESRGTIKTGSVGTCDSAEKIRSSASFSQGTISQGESGGSQSEQSCTDDVLNG